MNATARLLLVCLLLARILVISAYSASTTSTHVTRPLVDTSVSATTGHITSVSVIIVSVTNTTSVAATRVSTTRVPTTSVSTGRVTTTSVSTTSAPEHCHFNAT